MDQPRLADDVLERTRKRLLQSRSNDLTIIKIMSRALADELRPWTKRIETLEQQNEALKRHVEVLEQRKHVGVWLKDAIYNAGNQVTDHGSLWVCREDLTIERPGSSPSWQLISKRGSAAR